MGSNMTFYIVVIIFKKKTKTKKTYLVYMN